MATLQKICRAISFLKEMSIYRVNVKINLILTAVSFSDDYKLVKKRSECKSGAEKYKGKYKDWIEGCANACRGTAENFSFGTNGDCYCEFGTKNYKCEQITDHNGYNLYAFRGRYQLNSHNTMPNTQYYL